MKALSLQYTAFKEMLIGLADGMTMHVAGVNQHGRGKGADILFAEPFPYRASEAYLFSPPGYWKDVYDNPLYPDDFPTDLKSSMDGGATTATIPGTYTDGHYLMLYDIWEVWRMVEVDIVGGKVCFINGRDVSRVPEDVDYLCGEQDGFWTEFEINSAVMEDVDSELEVAIVDGDEIDGEVYVIVDGEDDLDVDIFVWYKAQEELCSEIWIPAISGIDGELTVKYDCESYLGGELTVTRSGSCEIAAALCVKRTDRADIDVAMFVDHISEICGEITVQRCDRNEIDAEINIQKVASSEFDASLYVAANGVGSKLLLASELYAIGCDRAELPLEVFFVARGAHDIASKIELERRECISWVDSIMSVTRRSDSVVSSEISVTHSDRLAQMGAVADLARRKSHDINQIDATFVVARSADCELESEIGVALPYVGKMELKTRTALQASMDCALLIAVDASDVLPSRLFILPETKIMETVAYANPASQIESELLIAFDGESAVPAEIYIQHHSTTEAVVDNTVGCAYELKTTINVTNAGRRNLPCEIHVLSERTAMAVSGALSHIGGNELGTEFEVACGGYFDLDSAIHVICKNAMAAVVNHNAVAVSMLPCEIIVGNTSGAKLDAEIAVGEAAGMEAAVQQTIAVGSSEIVSELSVSHKNSFELDSAMIVLKGSVLHTVADFISKGERDIASELCVSYVMQNELACEILVGIQKRMEACVSCNSGGYSDIESHIAIPFEKDLPAEIYVVDEGSKTKMEATAITVPPVVRHGVVTAIKDAVCYSYTPLTNYGKLPEFSIGKFTGGESFKGLIGFDLSALHIPHTEEMNYFGYETIRTAALKVYVTRPMVEDNVTIKVYRMSDDWFETKVNYRALETLPVYELAGECIAPKKMGEFSVDITKGFADWAHKGDKQSFIMAIEGRAQATKHGLYVSAREGFQTPRLEVEYFETLPNSAYADFDNMLLVNPNANMDSEITVDDPIASSLNSSIDIATKGTTVCDLKIDIDVMGNNFGATWVPSEIEIIGYPDESWLEADLSMMFWEDGADTASALDVVRDPLFGHCVYIM